MSKKLFVGNLPYSMTDGSLGDLFSPYGAVESSRIITDRQTGRSKGFGFVEMANAEEADKAINELNGKDVEGRALTVNEARPQEPRRPGGGFGGGGGGGRGGGGYGGGGGGGRGGFGGGGRGGGGRDRDRGGRDRDDY